MDKVVLGPGVYQYPFSKNLSDQAIEWAKKSNSFNWNKSAIGDGNVQQDIRTSSEFPLSKKNPQLAKDIKIEFVPALKDYAEEFQVGLAADEGFNLLRYDVGNSYDYHIDAAPMAYRVISALVYLNPSEYEGGETHFPNFKLSIKPEEPSIVLFPSNYVYIHAALPVTSGHKFIIVSWFRDRP